jgi:hypothetical protein
MRKLVINTVAICIVLAVLISLSVFASPETTFNNQSSMWNPSPPPDISSGELSQWNPSPPPDMPVPRLAQWNPSPPPDMPVPR